MFNKKVKSNNRGFRFYEFLDSYNTPCTIQKSSTAVPECLWLGLNQAEPRVLHGDAKKLGLATVATYGWVDYPLPEEVHIPTRMHLTRDQAKQLANMLLHFASSGDLPQTP